MAKHAFERAAAQRGVTIKHYHADNGRFADNAFIQDCQANRQILSYCGVSAHFQNGIAERRIRDLQERTRTSMLYAMNKWRKMVIINLWPYAMRHANDVANATPRKGQELSPLEMFSGVEIAPKLRHFHAFRCPTYVLDNALQSGQGAPKWKECSRLGVYLGPSPNHARSIVLVLNPRTGHVSPQFHVKFEDFFETVQPKATDLDAPDPEWKYLSGFATKKGTPKAATKGGLDGLLAPRRGAITTGSPRQGNHEDDQPLDQEQDPPLPSANDADAQETTDAHSTVPATTIPAQLPETPVAPLCQTRSGRVIKNTSRYDQSMTLRDEGIVAWELLIDQDEQEAHPTAVKQFAAQKAMEDPIAFAATTNPDILYWDQAMKAHDRDKFLEAVKVELDSHEQMGNYEPIPIEEVPKRNEAAGHGLVHATEKAHQNPGSVQVESTCKRAQRAARTRSALLGYLCPSSDMADGPLLLDPLSPDGLAHQTIRLCHGVPPSTSRDAPLPTLAAGVQKERNDTKNSRAQAQAQRVRSKTSRKGVESIYGPRHEIHRFHSQQVRPLLILSQVNRLFGLHR